MRLAQALLYVTDLPRMEAFYAGELGLPLRAREPGFVQLGADGGVLALHVIPPAYAPAITTPPVAREDGTIKLGFDVDDVAAVRARLVAAGHAMREPWRHVDLLVCDGLDPEGNVFQLRSRVAPAT